MTQGLLGCVSDVSLIRQPSELANSGSNGGLVLFEELKIMR